MSSDIYKRLDQIVKYVFEAGVVGYKMPDNVYLAHKDSIRAEARQQLKALIQEETRKYDAMFQLLINQIGYEKARAYKDAIDAELKNDQKGYK